jgi:alginate O-acetyltransferase complex protein AlgI
MLFNSIAFALFLPPVFLAYWFVFQKSWKVQNLFIVAVSYFFYSCWDWRFLSLILFSTLVDYGVGLALARSSRLAVRRALLGASLTANLGLLGLFKYYGFFVDTFVALLSSVGIAAHAGSLQVVLPVGISFYTFQTLSYTIDVYRRRIPPARSFVSFAAFVAFFPQLVAGPIERAGHLLAQFQAPRTFDYPRAVAGMRQILWGLVKKMVIADNCAFFANQMFAHPSAHNGSALALGVVFFAFQIYGDFSGYSDIAIGTSRLLGFDLMKNFAYPYFSRDIGEFWRRWHISLSTWFRDYLYIPLGGSRGSRAARIRNIFVIFLVSGLWHGANWTFVVWGGLHALFFLPLLLTGRNRQHLHTVADHRRWPSAREVVQMLSTFGMVALAWIVFRAQSLGHAWTYIRGLCSSSLLALPVFSGRERAAGVLVLVAAFVMAEWAGRHEEFALARWGERLPRGVRWGGYAFLVFLIGMFANTEESPFIYFQF